jgi:hypothetical protein
MEKEKDYKEINIDLPTKEPDKVGLERLKEGPEPNKNLKDKILDLSEKKEQPCWICGEKTTGQVCSEKCQKEWIEQNKVKKQKQNQQKEKQEKKEVIREAKKEANEYGQKVISKRLFWTLIGALIIFFLLLIWTNLNFSLKDFAGDTNVTVNNDHTITVDAGPEITTPITNENDFIINNYQNLTISNETMYGFIDRLTEKLLSRLNLTNST